MLKFNCFYCSVGGKYSSCLGDDTYIFIGNGTSVEKSILTGDSGFSWKTLIKTDSQILGFDVDIAKCILFCSVGSKNRNLRRGEIYAVSLSDNGTKKVLSGLGYPKQIAVNWITRKIYWCDSVLSTIEYSDFYGGTRQTLLKNVNRIEAVALDPCNNDIYWISKRTTFIIYKMRLDGTSRQVMVSSNLQYPNSLVINFVSSRIYWTDFYEIRTSDLDGRNISIVYHTQSRRPTGISLYHNMLYWAEWKFKRINTCATNGTNAYTLVNNVNKATAIHVLDRTRQLKCCE